MRIVSNMSPILNLAIIGQLALLRQQCGQIIIPNAVFDEFRLEQNLPGTAEISAAIKEGWISVRAPSRRDQVLLLARELDKGESEAIALALELKAELIVVDERDARRVFNSLRLNVIGVVGILAKAYKEGHLLSLENTILELKEKPGFYIDNKLTQAILKNI